MDKWKEKLLIIKEAFDGGGYFTNIFYRLYLDMNRQPLPNTISNYPSDLIDFISQVYFKNESSKGIIPDDLEFLDMYLDNYKIEIESNKNALVGFSGGKDSLSTILKLSDNGYNVTAFYVDGINRMYPNEKDIAIKISEIVGFDLVILNLKGIIAKSIYPDHPIKNQFILATMLDYGIKNNIPNYSLGSMNEDYIENMNIFFDWSDSIELNEEFKIFVKNYFNNFEYMQVLKNETQAFKYIIDSGRAELVEETISCVLPLRYRKNCRNANMKKFNIKLKDYHCGSCEKCAREYIYLTALLHYEKNEGYLKHCLNIWQNKTPEVFGLEKRKRSIDELLELWIDLDLLPVEREFFNV